MYLNYFEFIYRPLICLPRTKCQLWQWWRSVRCRPAPDPLASHGITFLSWNHPDFMGIVSAKISPCHPKYCPLRQAWSQLCVSIKTLLAACDSTSERNRVLVVRGAHHASAGLPAKLTADLTARLNPFQRKVTEADVASTCQYNDRVEPRRGYHFQDKLFRIGMQRAKSS